MTTSTDPLILASVTIKMPRLVLRCQVFFTHSRNVEKDLINVVCFV